ncbi:prepilin peptidase [Effusibacillus consociatus]|uniref:prepilin peptidase n=1 Tax=Effusibacillus consociatus TaxID=1117041 RepID=UPI0036D3AAD7
MMACSIVTDLQERRIPNLITLPPMAAGLWIVVMMASFQHHFEYLAMYAAAFLVAVGFCFLMEKGKVWSAGDSKLFLVAIVWINGVVFPPWGTTLLIGSTLLIHAGMTLLPRINERTLFRFWQTAFFQQGSSTRKCQYPGSLCIAAASLFMFVMVLMGVEGGG